MFDTTGHIAIAQLVFFLIAILPANYCLLKHGLLGILGWLFLVLFCLIRITGAAIIVSDESKNMAISEAGGIITSVAIAPLIIATAGVAHESFKSIESYRPILFGWIPHILAHVGCGGAVALLVVGYTNLEGSDSTPDKMKIGLDEIRGGGFVLVAIWIMTTAIVIASYHYPRALRGEKLLVGGVTIALIALIIRILYTVLSALIDSESYNPISGAPTAVKVILDVLPEFFLTLVLLAAGIASRNLRCETKGTSCYGHRQQDNLVSLEDFRAQCRR